MKKLNLLIFLLITVMTTQATVRTVNNNGGAQYNDIETAVIASSPGDTIYICGSVTQYVGPSTMKSNITFIGTGFNVQKQNAIKSTIYNTFYVGNGNVLMGLEIIGQIFYLDGNTGLTLRKCYLGSSFTSTGSFICNSLLVDRCITYGQIFYINKFINLVFTNTILLCTNLSNNLQASTYGLFDHCIFAWPNSANFLFAGSVPASGFTFSNNIFFNVYPNLVSAYTYSNNYSAYDLSTYGSGNLQSAVWPFIMNQGNFQNYSGYPYTINNFSVLPGSIAHNAANDGTDLGVYGGPTPFLNSGEPPIPQFDILNVIGTQFAPGGTMNIQFQSTIGN